MESLLTDLLVNAPVAALLVWVIWARLSRLERRLDNLTEILIHDRAPPQNENTKLVWTDRGPAIGQSFRRQAE